jgi:transaldolase
MSKLHRLFDEQGQSPWLDNLNRDFLRDGTLARFVTEGIRGVTANPTIFAKAIEGSDAYDEQFEALVSDGHSVSDAYWHLVIDDVRHALALLRPTFDASAGIDGFVSIEIAPELARDTNGTITAARGLHRRIDQPNVFIKIPATAEGVPAMQAMTAEGRSINVTLIFSLSRYRQVIEAYLSGLEEYANAGGDVRNVPRRRVLLRQPGRLRSRSAPRSHRYSRSTRPPWRRCCRPSQGSPTSCSATRSPDRGGPRWTELAAHGARVHRPLWASTSTKNPTYPDTLYVDHLIGPRTVNTLPETTIDAFEDHGTVARTIDTGLDNSATALRELARVGVDMDDVGLRLENQGVASFHDSFTHVLDTLTLKAQQLAKR